MAPRLTQIDPVRIITFTVGTIVGLILALILPFLLTAIYLYIGDVWYFIIRQPRRYREWNRQRKEWNKLAAVEGRRRHIFICRMDAQVRQQGLTEEDRFRYAGLMHTIYFPIRRPFPHRLIYSFDGLWDRVLYTLFKRGYFTDFTIKPEDWAEAKARATGRPDNEMAFFVSIFEDIPLQHAPSTSTVITSGSGSRRSSRSATSSMPSIAPPPYTYSRGH